MVTLWSVLFVVAFVAVLGGTAGFVEWYVRATYYLGFSGDHVAIFEGRPGGFLWFKPRVVETTQLTRAKVFAPYVPLLEHDMVETSYARARQVASKLGDANAFLALPTAATTASSTVSTTATTAVAATSTTLASATSTTAVGTSGGISTSGTSGVSTSGVSTSGTSGVGAPATGAVAGGAG